MRQVVWLLALVLGAASISFACGGDEKEKWEAETITIGSLFSTSGTGGAAFGPQQLRGAELAAKQINADDGVEGAQIVISQRDDGGDPAESASLMRALIEDEEVLAVLGPTFSNSAFEADPIATELGTTVLAVSNTGLGIVGDCDYPCETVFRDSLGEAAAIPANVKSFIASEKAAGGMGPSTAVVVHPAEDPFGESTAEIGREALIAEGLEVPAVFGGKSGLRKALSSDPEVLMITASSGEVAAEMIKAARTTDFRGAILGGNAFNSRVAAEMAGKAGAGARSATAWYRGNESEENTEFIKAYRAEYGEDPDQFAAQAYTGVLLLAEAAEDADLTFDDLATDRRALTTALASVETDTPLGEFRFTADHDVSQPIWIVEMTGSGDFKLVETINP